MAILVECRRGFRRAASTGNEIRYGGSTMTMTLSMMRLIISVASPEGAFGHEAKLAEEALLSRQTNVAAATWIREDMTRRDCDDPSGTQPLKAGDDPEEGGAVWVRRSVVRAVVVDDGQITVAWLEMSVERGPAAYRDRATSPGTLQPGASTLLSQL
jgi:hypothetical protein